MNQTTTLLAEKAQLALEKVCSGIALEKAPDYYSSSFVDYVNGSKFHGLDGIRTSVNLYRRIFSDLAFKVEEQVAEGSRVASRYVVTGTSYGRKVRFDGITVSRFEDGLVTEDWSITDSLGMLRQLGWWRAILVAIRGWRHFCVRK